MIKKVLLAAGLISAVAAQAQGLPELAQNNGRIAFIKTAGEQVPMQEQGALDFFTEAYGEEKVLTTSDAELMTTDDYDCLWIHIDRKGLGQGYDALPEEYKALAKTLKAYVEDGGHLYLSGFATQMLSGLGRCNQQPNVFGSGDGGRGSDKWTVSAVIGGNEVDHFIYNHLDNCDAYNHKNFGLLWGGGADIQREDHNCLWNGINTADFERNYSCKVLGQWGQNTGGDNAGIVEFYPMAKNGLTGKTYGTIMVNGLAACQWAMHEGDTNEYADNLKVLTANMLAYLANDESGVPYVPEDLKTVYPVQNEVLESTGKVALYTVFNSADELAESNAKEEKAAYEFIKNMNGGLITPANLADFTTEKYDCIWIQYDRVGCHGFDALPDALKSDEFINAVKAYVSAGGNLYVTKHANLILSRLDFSAPTEVGNQDGGNGNDIWVANVQHNGQDFTRHPMFQDIETVENFGMQMIQMLGNTDGLWREDHNCMWNMNNYGGHDGFCSGNNARVLATWGHNNTDAVNFAGIVEFFPNRADQPMKAISAAAIESRKGTILANGMAAYELAPRNEGTNLVQDNLNTMTTNALAYLSPKDAAMTGVESVAVAKAKVYAANGVLNVEGVTGVVTVYTLGGNLVLTQYVDGAASFELPIRGLLIVNSPAGAYKVAAK